jgi:hypothetical protein
MEILNKILTNWIWSYEPYNLIRVL